MNQLARRAGPLAALAMVGASMLLGATGARGSGSVTAVWAARYDHGSRGGDYATAMARDGSGNVYVTGHSDLINGARANYDYATIKYNSGGGQVWVARYNGPADTHDFPNAIKVDGSGNVYVTGSSFANGNFDYATVKYDSAGNQLWVARYDGPASGGDGATSLALDPGGNVYVAGNSGGIGNGDDYATVKYDANGNQLWVARYNGPGNAHDGALALAIDGSGYVYVTGYSSGGGTGNDCATLKYDSAGNQLWVARYNGPGNALDQATGLAVDAGGNVYTTGPSFGSGTGNDYATLKYDSAGNQLWVARYNGPANGGDMPAASNSLALDWSGNVLVTGYSTGVGTREDFTTVKYDSGGNQLWVTRYDNGGSDGANALAVDSSGGVYVTGNSEGPSYWGYYATMYATVKYSATGDQLWVERYNGPVPTQIDQLNIPSAVMTDSNGSAFVTGRCYTGIDQDVDWETLRYFDTTAASNETASFQVTRGGLRKSLGTGRWSQVVTVKNTSSTALPGPLSLVLDSLSPTATLFSKTGTTTHATPSGSPYQNSAASLGPGASVALTLEFTNPTNVAIGYTPRIVAGSGAR